jgi:hypothetical protein
MFICLDYIFVGYFKWPNRDPIQELGGLNLYGYIGNDPVNKTVRYGLDFWQSGGYYNWGWPGNQPIPRGPSPAEQTVEAATMAAAVQTALQDLGVNGAQPNPLSPTDASLPNASNIVKPKDCPPSSTGWNKVLSSHGSDSEAYERPIPNLSASG